MQSKIEKVQQNLDKRTPYHLENNLKKVSFIHIQSSHYEDDKRNLSCQNKIFKYFW